MTAFHANSALVNVCLFERIFSFHLPPDDKEDDCIINESFVYSNLVDCFYEATSDHCETRPRDIIKALHHGSQAQFTPIRNDKDEL